MNFLSITKVRLDSKECTLEKEPDAQDSDISSSTNEKINGNYGKENDEKQKKYKTVIGEKIWRPSRKGESGVKSLTMSPVPTNTNSESSSFPKLVAKEKDDRKGNKTENGILTMKRSSSAPGWCYVPARVTKQNFRLPCIPDLQTLSIIDDQPIETHSKTLVVEGKKLGSTGETGFTLDSVDNSNNLPKSDIKVIIEDHGHRDVQAKKLSHEDDEAIESEKKRFHGDLCDDSFPAIKKTEFRVKSAYASSSKIYNTYLQSRFGKSVYESGAKKTASGAGKKYQVYWAPVLIKKQMLYNRTVGASGRQEYRGERNSTEDNRSKKRKVNIHGNKGNLCQQESECSSGVA